MYLLSHGRLNLSRTRFATKIQTWKERRPQHTVETKQDLLDMKITKLGKIERTVTLLESHLKIGSKMAELSHSSTLTCMLSW